MPQVLSKKQVEHLIELLKYGEGHYQCHECGIIQDELEKAIQQNPDGLQLIPVKITTTYEEL
jgi:hypothetical protein